MYHIVKFIMFIKGFLKRINDDFVAAFAAHVVFFIIISFFPFIMFLLTLVQYLPITQSDMMQFFNEIVPSSFNSFVISIINEVYSKSTKTLISITAITALWSSGRFMLSLIKGLNSVYGIKETRGTIVLRIFAAIYTLIFAVMIIISLVILVFGNSIYEYVIGKFQIPILRNLLNSIIDIRTIAGFLILTIFFLIMYLFVPNRKSRIIRELPGAMISAGGWLIFSYVFSIYFQYREKTNSYMYGSLTTIVLLMLWLYFCMYILFIGAEINIIITEKNVALDFFRKRKKKI